MRRWIPIIAAAALLLVLIMLLPGRVAPARAQPGGTYDLTWSTVDGGGQMFSEGGAYTLGGTIGQPDAGLLRGGGYTLEGGFWASGAAAVYEVYLPLVVRNAP